MCDTAADFETTPQLEIRIVLQHCDFYNTTPDGNYEISDDEPAFTLDDEHAYTTTFETYGLERNRAAADNTLSLKKSGLLAVSLGNGLIGSRDR